MGSGNVSGVVVALMVAVLIASLGTGWLTYQVYKGSNNTPKTVTVTTTLVTPSVTEVTRTLVVTNVTTAPPVTVTETKVVINNVTSTVVTTLPPVTVTQSVPYVITETVTNTITNTVTRTVIENQVMYGLGKLLELIDKANTSIYVNTGAEVGYWKDVEALFTKLKEARDRGVDVRIVLQVTKYEVEANQYTERKVIQLIIDLGLADVTKVYNFTYCLDADCEIMTPLRVASYAIIDGEYLAISRRNEWFIPESVMIGKAPKELIKDYTEDFITWTWKQPDVKLLIDWLVENGLGKYFNIP